MNIIDKFKLADEKEDFRIVSDNIQSGVEFKGTNLWILIFAIFIASLGLNVNSTAVIIGAMLISPLMGPIIGMGFGMAINDIPMLKKSFHSYLFAATVALATSTIFFLIQPINEAHSEMLARISPNGYDVMIALFGGLAGILATSSKLKGNVIPGAAIATALMPPLCTAGYGLATLQYQFFLGAFYLFIINTVFIALATLITARFLHFPFRQLPKKEDEIKAKRVVWGIVLITLLPSIYFGYDMVQQKKFQQKANQFIESEVVFPHNYLFTKEIDPKNKTITLTFGGQNIEEQDIALLKSKLSKYYLPNTTLIFRQGFSSVKNNENDQQPNQSIPAFNEKGNQISKQVFNELKIQYPSVQSCILQTAVEYSDSLQQTILVAVIQSKTTWEANDKTKIEQWLKVRMNDEKIKICFE
jgi:uncharacterized hydrophobic protein (TIGR00271 family)